MDHFGPFWTILDHFRSFWNILEHFGQFQTIYGNIGTCTFELTIENALGVNDAGIDMSSIVLYPNPAADLIILSNPNNVDLNQATIYDMSGRLIKAIDLHNAGIETEIDISVLASATYMVILESDSGQISKLIVKE